MRFDFRDRLGMCLDDVGVEFTFGEAIDLVDRLRVTPGTHTHASVRDWSWPSTLAEIAATRHAEWFINVHRDRSVSPQPITLAYPWPDADVVAPEVRAEYEQQLIARSAFAPDPEEATG